MLDRCVLDQALISLGLALDSSVWWDVKPYSTTTTTTDRCDPMYQHLIILNSNFQICYSRHLNLELFH